MINLQMIFYCSELTRLSDRTMSLARSLPSFVTVDRSPAASTFVTLVRPFYLILQSIRRHSIAAKHSSRIALKVFGGSWPLIHLPTTKAGSLNGITNGEAEVMELT
jgi:hypothetical protein